MDLPAQEVEPVEHVKRYHAETVQVRGRDVVVEGPVPPERLRPLRMHPTLDAFRRPDDQKRALEDIAALPEGRVIIARDGDVIVGYVTFHYPDPLERWSEEAMDDLIELGAVEVADDYRSAGLAKRMIRLAFYGGQMDRYIVFTTEYYWHWDLRGSGLNVWQYRAMMEKLMKSVDMIWYATDDPEICAHPANCLMARVGPLVPQESVERFDRLRFRHRGYMF